MSDDLHIYLHRTRGTLPGCYLELSDTPSNNVMCCEGDRVVVAVAVAGVSSAEHVAAAGAIVVAQVPSLLPSKRWHMSDQGKQQ